MRRCSCRLLPGRLQKPKLALLPSCAQDPNGRPDISLAVNQLQQLDVSQRGRRVALPGILGLEAGVRLLNTVGASIIADIMVPYSCYHGHSIRYLIYASK